MNEHVDMLLKRQMEYLKKCDFKNYTRCCDMLRELEGAPTLTYLQQNFIYGKEN